MIAIISHRILPLFILLFLLIPDASIRAQAFEVEESATVKGMMGETNFTISQRWDLIWSKEACCGGILSGRKYGNATDFTDEELMKIKRFARSAIYNQAASPFNYGASSLESIASYFKENSSDAGSLNKEGLFNFTKKRDELGKGEGNLGALFRPGSKEEIKITAPVCECLKVNRYQLFVEYDFGDEGKVDHYTHVYKEEKLTRPAKCSNPECNNTGIKKTSLPSDAAVINRYDNGFPSDLEYKLIGNGETTGEIMKMIVYNPGNQAYLLPFVKMILKRISNHQAYVGIFPDLLDLLTIEPKERDTIPIIGECLDVRKKPLGLGEAGPSISAVITPYSNYNLPGPHEPLPEGFTKINPLEKEIVIVNPITGDVFPYDIDFDTGIESASPLIFEIDHKLDSTFTNLYEGGSFSSLPISNTKVLTELPQLTKWQVFAVLQGDPYLEEEFNERMDTMLSTRTGVPVEQLPEEVKQEWTKGKGNIWEMVSFVGLEAKVLKQNDPSEMDTSPPCKFTCPMNNSWVNRNDLSLYWECNEPMEGPFNLTVSSDKGGEIEFTGINENSFQLPSSLDQEVNYSFSLNHPDFEYRGGPIFLNTTTSPDSMATIGEMNKKLDKLWKQVKDANEELENNPLVQEVRTIEMIREVLGSSDAVKNYFDLWLKDEFPLPDLSKVEEPKDLINYIAENRALIKQVLEYAKKMLKFVAKENNKPATNAISKIDKMIENLDSQEEIQSYYEDLLAAIKDIRAYLGAKMSDFAKDKIESKLRGILARRLAEKAVPIFSAAMDAFNFADALIAENKLAEAKKLYYLLHFDMLKLAHTKQRYRVDKDWNDPEKGGLPQVEWADCKEVVGHKVELRIYVYCWIQKPGGAINEGKWEKKQIKFADKKLKLVQENFTSKCKPCAFPYQIEWADLEEKAKGCERAYLEVVASYNDHDVPVFSGVYKP